MMSPIQALSLRLALSATIASRPVEHTLALEEAAREVLGTTLQDELEQVEREWIAICNLVAERRVISQPS